MNCELITRKSEAIVRTSRRIGLGGLMDFLETQVLYRNIDFLLTPERLLKGRNFDPPEAITPRKYPNFENLLSQRLRIRDLLLLPIKTDEDRATYKAQSRKAIVTEIESYFEYSPITVKKNKYPYFLPLDVEQYIIWLRDLETSRENIILYIARLLRAKNIKSNEIILFERPLNIDAKMVRGTIPEYRHVHLWIKGWNEELAKKLSSKNLDYSR